MTSIRCILCLIVILCVTDTFSKPRFTPRIYGGHLTETHQIPFITSIQVKNRWNFLVHVCGGSIVSSKLVLTAAHCTESKSLNAELYRVFFGANEKSEGHEFKVERFLVHPLYNSLLLKNDLMFIKLKESIKFSSTVQPIASHRELIGNGVRVLTAGWGKSNVRKFIHCNSQDWAKDLENSVLCKEYFIEKCKKEKKIKLFYLTGWNHFTQIHRIGNTIKSCLLC